MTDLLDGALPADVEAAALEHLATCERCEITLAETRSQLDLAAGDRPVGLDPPARSLLLSRIVAGVRADP